MGTAAYNRKKETKFNQREAAKAGTVHPRSLARSIAKAANRASGQKESRIRDSWRKIAAKLPRYGRKYLRTEEERMAKRGARALKGV